MAEKVIKPLRLDHGWKAAALAYLRRGRQTHPDEQRLTQLESALERLRKQHLWGDISYRYYREERRQLELEKAELAARLAPPALVSLEKAAHLLTDLYELWRHPGVTPERRKDFLREIFSEIRIRGTDIVSVAPKRAYLPLFAYAAYTADGRYGRGERI